MSSTTQTPALVFSDFKVGQTATLDWHVVSGEIDAFAALSGDHNPLHVDADFATAKGFKDRVAHGMLLASKLSAFAGMVLPGQNCLLLEFNLSWPTPVFAGDHIVIEGEIVEASESIEVLKISFKARKPDGAKQKTVGRGWFLCKVQS